MSMKHTGRYHKAADKKRRLNRARLKNEARERRVKFEEQREAEKKTAAK